MTRFNVTFVAHVMFLSFIFLTEKQFGYGQSDVSIDVTVGAI